MKWLRSLALKKNRQTHSLFLAEGPKIVPELIQSDFEVNMLCATEPWLQSHEDLLARQQDMDIRAVSGKELERISLLKTPNQVVAAVRTKHPEFQVSELSTSLTLVLDDVRDPGNLGTIVRMADWFGIQRIICSENSVDIYNPKVIQATMGSVARIPVMYAHLKDFFAQLPTQNPELPVYGAVLNGNNVFEEQLMPHGLILLGNESNGIAAELEQHITVPLTIPSHGGAESLNVGMAASVICAEFRRKFPLE